MILTEGIDLEMNKSLQTNATVKGFTVKIRSANATTSAHFSAERFLRTHPLRSILLEYNNNRQST
jgi:hypothetical protein